MCRPEAEIYRLPLASLIGQPAFSNSTFRQTDLRSALHRLQATKSKLRHKLKPHHKAGQEVIKLLQVRHSPADMPMAPSEVPPYNHMRVKLLLPRFASRLTRVVVK